MIRTRLIKNSVKRYDNVELSDHEVWVDNLHLPKVRASASEGIGKGGKRNLEFSLFTEDISSGKTLLTQTLNDFPNFEYINFPIDLQSSGFQATIYFHPANRRSKLHPVTCYLTADLLSWKEPYSFTDFEKSVSVFHKRKSYRDFRIKVFNSQDETNIELKSTVRCGEGPLAGDLSQFLGKCKEIYLEIRKIALSATNDRTVLNYFNFPEEMETPCQQYLQYFARFLKDLGINVHSEIKHEAGRVLFSVTPKDEVEALDKIREALAIYLNLPSSPIIYDESYAAMRLQQQVENLQHSQKMAGREIQLAEKVIQIQSETIQEKNLIISQKDATIDQQSRIIEKITSKSIMMDSLENKEEFEKVFDGLEFGESQELKEKLGIKFNPISSLKSLSNKLTGNDDEIISLNLEERAEEK